MIDRPRENVRKTYKLYVGGEGFIAGPVQFLHRTVMGPPTGPERELFKEIVLR